MGRFSNKVVSENQEPTLFPMAAFNAPYVSPEEEAAYYKIIARAEFKRAVLASRQQPKIIDDVTFDTSSFYARSKTTAAPRRSDTQGRVNRRKVRVRVID